MVRFCCRICLWREFHIKTNSFNQLKQVKDPTRTSTKMKHHQTRFFRMNPPSYLGNFLQFQNLSIGIIMNLWDHIFQRSFPITFNSYILGVDSKKTLNIHCASWSILFYSYLERQVSLARRHFSSLIPILLLTLPRIPSCQSFTYLFTNIMCTYCSFLLSRTPMQRITPLKPRVTLSMTRFFV